MNSCYKIDMSITTTVKLPILDDESTQITLEENCNVLNYKNIDFINTKYLDK